MKINELSLIVRSITTSYVYGVHPAEWPENAHLIDEDEDDDIPETMELPLDIFIKYQVSLIINDHEPADYGTTKTDQYYEEYKKQYNIKTLKSIHYTHMRTIIIPQIENLVALSLTIEKYNLLKYQDMQVKWLKTLILLNYALCWLYIIIISLPHAAWSDIVIALMNTIPMNNPFIYP